MQSRKEIVTEEIIILLFKVLSFILFLSIFIGAIVVTAIILTPLESLIAVTVATYLFSKIFKEEEAILQNDQI